MIAQVGIGGTDEAALLLGVDSLLRSAEPFVAPRLDFDEHQAAVPLGDDVYFQVAEAPPEGVNVVAGVHEVARGGLFARPSEDVVLSHGPYGFRFLRKSTKKGAFAPDSPAV